MRRIASAASIALLVVLAACSRSATAESEPAPASASSLDPVGVYDFTASMAGMTRTGTINIERTNGALGGFATVDGEPEPAQVTSVETSGNDMTVQIVPPDGSAVTFQLAFTGAAFTGTIAANGMTLDVTGAKRAD